MNEPVRQADPAEYADFAEALARQSGVIMRDYFYRQDQHVAVKPDKTLVTDADKRVNALVIEQVQAVWPAHGVLGEEASHNTGSSELWVCDPIDGTNGFIAGLPTAVCSLAYVRNGRPEAAVVYNPLTDELFRAVHGAGATVNGMPLRVSARRLDQAVIAAPGGLSELLRELPLNQSLKEQGATVRPFGGMVYQGCLVARGKIDGRIFPGTGAHDVAAVKLIIEEAGGVVTSLDGTEQRYDGPIRGAILSNSVIHDDLFQVVTAFGTDRYLRFDRAQATSPDSRVPQP